MTYDFECSACGNIEEHYVATFDSREDEICGQCGTKMQRLVANSARIEIWKHTHIPEVDKNIHFRSMKHAREVARAKGLRINQDYLMPYDLEYRKKNEERLMRQPVQFDMAKSQRRATG